MTPSPDQIIAVVVTYHPNDESLARLLAAAQPQVRALVVVDNTPEARGASTERQLPPGMHRIALGDNVGLAAAINIGCRWAREQGAEFVLLFDQDSEPATDMVAQLCASWRSAAAAGGRIGAAGPRFNDERGAHTAPFLRAGFPRNRVVDPGQSDAFVDVDMLITSGCLISLQALDDVGLMDESLFIDNVDIEWCFRAKAQGWRLVGSPRAGLAHRLGDEHVIAPAWARALGKASAIHHGPVRLYYITRNRIRLYWMPHVPLAWKAQDMLRLPAKIVLSLWIAPERGAAAKALARGMLDGLANRGGAMP